MRDMTSLCFSFVNMSGMRWLTIYGKTISLSIRRLETMHEKKKIKCPHSDCGKIFETFGSVLWPLNCARCGKKMNFGSSKDNDREGFTSINGSIPPPNPAPPR